jgi:hypothetical protein
MAYITGPALRVIQGKSDVELDALLAKVTLAASLMTMISSLMTMILKMEFVIAMRNGIWNLRIFRFELLIPTIEHGRKFALSFYYGKILASIHSVIQMRATFHQTEEDGPKITAYIVYKGQHCYEVSNWR